MKKIVIPVLLVMIMSGCFGSQAARRYYQVQMLIPPNVNTQSINRVIYIDTVYTENLYDDFRVIYRVSPYQLNYYPYDFWVKRPGVMLQNSLVEFFRQSGIFTRVIDKLSDSEPDLILKSRLYVIEEDESGDPWFGRLSMDIEICDFKVPETVLVFHRFDRKMPFPSRNVNQLPGVVSEILRGEMDIVIGKLAVQLKQ
jgi:hypothetical protein